MADDKPSRPPGDHPELRTLIHAQYRFEPRPAANAAPAPAWSTHSSGADLPPAAIDGATIDTGVVRLPPVIVHGDAPFRAIDSALAARAAQARVQKTYSRFGIGEHELHLGKLPVHVLTEFGIPVMISLKW